MLLFRHRISSISSTLQDAVSARLAQKVQCIVKSDSWSAAYSGNAYVVEKSDTIAVCGKYTNGNDIDEDKLEAACAYSTMKCFSLSLGTAKNACVKDRVKPYVDNSGFCGNNDYILFVTKSSPGYNGYIGQVEKVRVPLGKIELICTLMCFDN